jgi:hypothetical protein
VLWMLGSRTPAADSARMQRRLPLISPPRVQDVTPTLQPGSAQLIQQSAVIGRTFEDRVMKDIMPIVAEKLQVKPVSKLCRLTRHVAHSGDIAIHYRSTIGMMELKNHARALPVTDRRRFFDSVLINHRILHWAILATSRCSVPHFGEKGYTIVGQLIVGEVNKSIPIAFICGLDTLGPNAVETAIRALTDGQSPLVGPQWSSKELLERGEATRTLCPQWGTGGGTAFLLPPGAIF